MKIYISDMDLAKININNIHNYIISNDIITELYSDEGIFINKNNQGFKKLLITDGNIQYIKQYIENYNIIIDESFYYKSKEYISRLPNNHYNIKLNKYEYKLDKKSPVTLVIEICEKKNVTNIYFMLTDKHGKYSIPDINNPFIKETINSFLKKIY